MNYAVKTLRTKLVKDNISDFLGDDSRAEIEDAIEVLENE
jgi:hypothetical protein